MRRVSVLAVAGIAFAILAFGLAGCGRPLGEVGQVGEVGEVGTSASSDQQAEPALDHRAESEPESESGSNSDTEPEEGTKSAPSEEGASAPDGAQYAQRDASVDDKEAAMDVSNVMISANGASLACELVDNDATRALVGLLQEGSLTYVASDYGGFEKVGSIGHRLPTSDVRINAEAGDVVLYQGDKLVILYGPNSWSYTEIGHVDDTAALRNLLGSGDVEITLELA